MASEGLGGSGSGVMCPESTIDRDGVVSPPLSDSFSRSTSIVSSSIGDC